ncbi:hypothetical protein AB1N83_012574 [Pleurotus pulmonarius]
MSEGVDFVNVALVFCCAIRPGKRISGVAPCSTMVLRNISGDPTFWVKNLKVIVKGSLKAITDDARVPFGPASPRWKGSRDLERHSCIPVPIAPNLPFRNPPC